MNAAARTLLRLVSPRHRRWFDLLDSLQLNPEALARPVREPGPKDFVICGTPRSGTSLLCAMLFQPPGIVTVMEPWDGLRLPPAELFESLRSELRETGGLARGRLDLEALAERRVKWWPDGSAARVPTKEGFQLGVKWPAFWRYLELLESTRFLVCVRHPYDTLASFQATGGRLAQGLDYDVPFNRSVNDELERATTDPLTRRVLMVERIHRAIAARVDDPCVHLVRYEDWFEDPEGALERVGAFLDADTGAPPIQIRPPQKDVRLDDRGRALVREHCRSAAALGYEL